MMRENHLVSQPIVPIYTYFDTTLAQKPKLMGLGPVKYSNYSIFLYFVNVGYNIHKCTHNNTVDGNGVPWMA